MKYCILCSISVTCTYALYGLVEKIRYNKLKNIITYNEIRNNRYGYFKNIELESDNGDNIRKYFKHYNKYGLLVYNHVHYNNIIHKNRFVVYKVDIDDKLLYNYIIIETIDEFVLGFMTKSYIPPKIKCNFIADVKNNKIIVHDVIENLDTAIKDAENNYNRYVFLSLIYVFLTISMFHICRM